MSALIVPSSASGSTPGSAGLDIPEARDGYFGYTEEKSLQQIEEKYWAHRRGSETYSEAANKPLSRSMPMRPTKSRKQSNTKNSLARYM
jgi:AMP deaminase